jgi:ATP-binding cassette, subfamily B, bacterial IrtA/YbtP
LFNFCSFFYEGKNMKILFKFQKYMGKRKALIPVSVSISAISAALGMAPLVFIWLIVRHLVEKDADSSFISVQTYGWWAAGTAIAGLLLYFIAAMLSHLAAFRVETNMRREAMKKVIEMPLGFFDKNTSGKVRKIIDDNASITHSFLAHQMPDLAGTILTPVAALALIMFFDWKLGLVCLIPIAIAMSTMGMMMGKRGRYFMKKYMDALEDMNTEAVEYVRGVPVVKVFQQTVFSFKNFHDSICRYRDMVNSYTLLWEKPMSTYMVVIHGFAYFLVPAAVLIIGGGGEISRTVVNLFFYILVTPVFAECIMRSMHLNQAMGQANEAISRLDNLMTEASLPVPNAPVESGGYDIQFEDVTFRYPGANKNAVENISFDISEGKTVALVGPSGSGKTTLARLLPRFWDPKKGTVRIGGADIKKMDPKKIMNNVSFVFQNNRLFKTTLHENIKFGNPSATEDDIAGALASAQCTEIVERLPEGLHTSIGVDGTYLSGGEQQRIALSRAILKDAPIVVLDEATAFADPENEHLIQQALSRLTKGKTVLMIAHRLSSVVNVDKIIVMVAGRIVETGTHAALFERNGVYARMWREYQQAVRWKVGAETTPEKPERNDAESEAKYA